MRIGRFLTIFCFVAALVGTSLAQTAGPPSRGRTPRIDAREKVQKERIKEGIKSGELTRREARKLIGEQKKMRVHEAKAKADGKVTPRERARLHRELDKASQDIARQKHDRQKRK